MRKSHVRGIQDRGHPHPGVSESQGKEVDRHLGALSKEEVLKKLNDLKFIR